MNELLSYGQVMCEDNFEDKIVDLSKVSLPHTTVPFNISADYYRFTQKGTVSLVEKEKNTQKGIKLDPDAGHNFLMEYLNGNVIQAYDESIDKFPSIEGDGYLVCHSLVYLTKKEYIPLSYLTFGFFTQSEKLAQQLPTAISVNKEFNSLCTPLSEADSEKSKSELVSKAKYAVDRSNLIISRSIPNSIIFIDGPLIGGQISHFTLDMVKKLISEKNETPIFIVKNSSSNLVVDNIKELHGQYNSDLHWAYSTLNPGERSPFFFYQDQTVENNKKVFCYIRPFKKYSPQRIEFHPSVYFGNESFINEIINLIYYLYLDQGEGDNIQVRPIVIAEMYAREVKKMYSMKRIMDGVNLLPTMNKQRGMA